MLRFAFLFKDKRMQRKFSSLLGAAKPAIAVFSYKMLGRCLTLMHLKHVMYKPYDKRRQYACCKIKCLLDCFFVTFETDDYHFLCVQPH